MGKQGLIKETYVGTTGITWCKVSTGRSTYPWPDYMLIKLSGKMQPRISGQGSKAKLSIPAKKDEGGFTMKSGVEIIEIERKRQIEEEGHSSIHDDSYKNEQLAYAAAAYTIPLTSRRGWSMWLWPWRGYYFKPCIDPYDVEGRVHELAKAGALIASEIDRLQRILNKDQYAI